MYSPPPDPTHPATSNATHIIIRDRTGGRYRPRARRVGLCQGVAVGKAVLSGRYELRTVLGRGGMAEVWLGFDRRLDRAVAVKILPPAGPADPSARDRFDREARTVARLSHPNIVAVHDVGTDAGSPAGGAEVSYLVMELVQGGSLADRLAAGPLPVAAAVAVAVQVCDALEAAHAAGVVHRDVKPANILFTGAAADRVKVCDFGIARVTGAGQAELTASKQVLGTSAYMAPEQATGGPVDARSDIYALGCVLYAMLVGHPPFTGGTPMQLAARHVNQPVVPASTLRPGLPPQVDRVLGALLAKRPEDRPASAARAGDLLRRLADGTEPAAVQAPPVRATAAVVAPTRAMPVTSADEPTAAGGRAGIRPAGVVLAGAGALVVAAVVTAVLVAGRAGQPSTGAAASGSPAAAAPAASSAGPAGGDPSPQRPGDALAALRGTVSVQAGAGTIDGQTARELTKRLDQVGRDIAKGDTGKAAQRVAELRTKLDEQHRDGDIQQDGYTAVAAGLDRLAASLPPPGDDD